MTSGQAASIHARLLTLAKERGEEFNLVLTRYGIERFLYRLSIADCADRYCLKGALLFDSWFDMPHRPTRDADMLGFGPSDAGTLLEDTRTICAIEVDDGIVFDTASISVVRIREGAPHDGLRLKLIGRLGNARCHVQMDVGFGDAVTPGPEEITYPTLLRNSPSPRLRAYPRATVVAEKLEAITRLGMTNTRLKDYFDLHALAMEGAVSSEELANAIVRTFVARNTPLPDGLPTGLGVAFATEASKVVQWSGFLARNRLKAPALDEVIAAVRAMVTEPLQMARALFEPNLDREACRAYLEEKHR